MGKDAIDDEPQDDKSSHHGDPLSQVGPPAAAGGGAGGGGGSSSSSSGETPSSRAGSGPGGPRSVASTAGRRSLVASDAQGVEDDEVVEINERANRIEIAKAACELKELALGDLHIWVLVREGYCNATDLGTLLSSDGLKQLFARMTEVEPLSVRVRESLSWFYQWLRVQAEADPDLESLDLDKFDREAMQKLIAKSDTSATSRSKRPYGTGAAGKGPDGSKLPTFNGQAENWIVWDKKFQAYLSQIHNGAGVPMNYVISDGKEDTNPAIQEMFDKEPKKGTVWELDNYTVHSILTTALCDGAARSFLDQYKGKGAETYNALRGTYASKGKVQSRVLTMHRKLDGLRYTEAVAKEEVVGKKRKGTTLSIFHTPL
jgi:hypothetical protein